MFVWGWSTKEIGVKKILGNCPSCSLATLVIVGFQRVFDIFWIPVFPLGKSSCIRCQSCEKTYIYEPSADEMAIQNSSFKTPWWSFSGLFIIIVLMIFGRISNTSMQKEYDSFKENPTLGTYFIFKNIDDKYKETPYFFAKIVSIEEDKIILYLSQYAYPTNNRAAKGVSDSKITPKKLLYLDVEMPKEFLHSLDIQSLID